MEKGSQDLMRCIPLGVCRYVPTARLAIMSVVLLWCGGVRAQVSNSEIVATPNRVDFGMTEVGEESTQRVVLRNQTRKAARNIDVTIRNARVSPFSLGGFACPQTLSPAGSCVVKITYRPYEAKRSRGQVVVYSLSGILFIELTGSGVVRR